MLLLAWRNVWRNHRRSLLTIASIGFGLAAILFGQSLVKTIQAQFIDKATGLIGGHMEIQSARSKNFKFPEVLFSDLPSAERALGAVPQIAAFEARILTTGLASSRTESEGVLLCAVEPKRDPDVLAVHAYLKKGSYLTGAPGEVVIGDGLAKTLGMHLGEKMVLMAQASDGSMGAQNFKIVGLTHMGSQSFDKNIVYLPLPDLQGMLAMEGKANNFVIRLKEPDRLEEARAAVSAALRRPDIQVLTWREFAADLVGLQKYQNAILQIVLVIVFTIVALGILNTLLMAMFERVREFGVLQAIGARPSFILRLVLAESCVLGFFGILLGLAVGCGLILYYHCVGLELPLGKAMSYFLPFDAFLHLRFVWSLHWIAIATVAVTSLLAGLPPALRAARLKPVDCLRHR